MNKKIGISVCVICIVLIITIVLVKVFSSTKNYYDFTSGNTEQFEMSSLDNTSEVTLVDGNNVHTANSADDEIAMVANEFAKLGLEGEVCKGLTYGGTDDPPDLAVQYNTEVYYYIFNINVGIRYAVVVDGSVIIED